jgi:hypothetical protein
VEIRSGKGHEGNHAAQMCYGLQPLYTLTLGTDLTIFTSYFTERIDLYLKE